MTLKPPSIRPVAKAGVLAAFLSVGIQHPIQAAQQTPSAGSLGNQLNQDSARQLPSRPSDAPLQEAPSEQESTEDEASETVSFESVRFDGAQSLTEAELAQLVAPWTHRDVNMAQLRLMLSAVENAYYQRGFMAVSAILPMQNLQGGVLEVVVTEGRYQHPAVRTYGEREHSFLNNVVMQATCKEACDGQTLIRTEQVDRALYLLNDIPGVSAHGTLKAGELPGTSLLQVNVAPIKRFGGYANLSNNGNPFTGREVLNTGAHFNSSLVTGDQFSLDAVSSLEALQHKTGLQQVGLNYGLPVGTMGTRLGGGYSHLEYRLNQQFEKLSAKGSSNTANAWVSHPLWLSHEGRMDLRVSHEQSRYADEQLRFERARDVDTTTIDISGNLYGDRQVTGWRLSSTFGTLTYHNFFDQFLDEVTRKSAGGFTRHRLDAFGLKGLGDGWELFGAVRGQLANKNLDSSQGLVLAGPTAVRAYSVNSQSVDEGWQGSLELRYRTQALGAQWAVSGFYDTAEGQVNRNPWGNGTDIRLRMSGAGAYLSGTFAQQYNLRLTYAQRLNDNLKGPIDKEQFWVDASTTF